MVDYMQVVPELVQNFYLFWVSKLVLFTPGEPRLVHTKLQVKGI